MATRPLSAVVLAAGQGTRMRSTKAKPLHELCGRPMILHVLDALAELPLERTVVVVGREAEELTKTVQEHAPDGLDVHFAEQTEQLGTGDAAMVALAELGDDLDEDDVLVLPGDTPLLTAATLADLGRQHRLDDAGATILTARFRDPGSYGRIVRGRDDRVERIVEAVDASPDELDIDEVNTGIYCFRRSLLAPALRRVSPENEQGEYYLTDVIGVLAEAGYRISAVEADDPAETSGVNDRSQLAAAEAMLRWRINAWLMRSGVTMVDPARTYVDADVTVGPDTVLLPGTMLQGRTVIGEGCRIGPDARIKDSVVGDGAVIETSTVVESEIGVRAHVGPYAALSSGTVLPDEARTGALYTR